MGHFLLIVFGMIFSALYGFGIGLFARVWWMAREPGETRQPGEAEKAGAAQERSHAA
jgi:hypothetical protein